MKRITIYQENSEPLSIVDDDDRTIEDLSDDLQQIFKVDRIICLKATSGNYLIKPHKITSIEICEEPSKKLFEGDYITDAD